MWLRTSCNLRFTAGGPTPFILMLRPRSGAQQWVARETYILTPSVPVVEFTDAYGNLCQRLIAPPGEFSIRTSADVMTADTLDVAPGAPFDEVRNLPDSVLTYLLPSRYCESDRFVDMAREIVAGAAPGYDQVACITDWIRREVRFNSASIHDHMAATEVNQRREGVCRDLAHLGIALCRALSIPARMVAGYLHGLSPMDMHAWFEAHVGGRWYTFDATQDGPRAGRVVVAYGHDAANVAIFTQFGPALTSNEMRVEVELLEAAPA
ncbi:transglutaminase domain-containing protein [Pseudoduganella namucuonensis]|uniref:Transglutaminase-like enzyme, putative cysteine protease n=1 Tax=Pseudoduganella namucuonensis TaxID=1035707 RepID=A0A1I7M1T3_9BURK|nr:transglutaminase family protein [Pseudoduganella namucuonensis]SFV15898.1 Transglutaminase-like enzyme, putative cysteine protease [Pseudoduganella namucuonensis]